MPIQRPPTYPDLAPDGAFPSSGAALAPARGILWGLLLSVLFGWGPLSLLLWLVWR